MKFIWFVVKERQTNYVQTHTNKIRRIACKNETKKNVLIFLQIKITEKSDDKVNAIRFIFML